MVTVWQYQDSNPTPVHRQWMLFPLTASQQPDGIVDLQVAECHADNAVYDLLGRRTTAVGRGIYIVRGRKVVVR